MAEIVGSIRPVGVADAQQQAAAAVRAGADWVELRLDAWPRDGDLAAVIGRVPVPVIASCRLRRDGGGFAGSPRDRQPLLGAAVEAGARAIDLEDWESWTPPRSDRLWVIRSHHDLAGVPTDLPALRDALLARGDLAKIVVTAADCADVAPVLALQAASDPVRQPTCAFAMGDAALASRVLAGLRGAPLAYGCLPDAATAPGQPTIEELRSRYRVQTRGAATRVFGLLGMPARHSAGPQLHNRALQERGVDGVYLPFDTERPAEVLAMLADSPRGGLSVTAPHKAAVVPLCRAVDAVAAACGVVNTLAFDATPGPTGHNTDVDGVIWALRGLPPPAAGTAAAVLGTGGAARAAVVALRRLGYAVAVLGREPARIAAWAAARGATAAPLEAAVLRDTRPRVVVHATPVGAGDPDARLLPSWRPASGVAVLDMVYRPAWTRLLRDAAAAGAVPIGGVEMFLGQAAAQLRWFTGDAAVEPESLREFLA